MIGEEQGYMKRHGFLLALSLAALLWTAGCGRQAPPPAEASTDEGTQTVELTVWGAEEDAALLEEIFDSFRSHYAGQANFQITYQPQSESNCKDVLLGDLEGGADVFAFADDQVAALAAAGGLDPVENAESIRAASLSAAADAASVEGTLYAYPLTADNGYFLYYNKAYFTEEDIQSLERMLEAAAQAECAVVFAGAMLPPETDDYNRPTLDTEPARGALIRRAAAVNKNVIVVLMNCESVVMPWIDGVRAVLDMWYGGQGCGAAAAQLLFGERSPGGKLPVTMPRRLEDCPGPLYLCQQSGCIQLHAPDLPQKDSHSCKDPGLKRAGAGGEAADDLPAFHPGGREAGERNLDQPYRDPGYAVVLL